MLKLQSISSQAGLSAFSPTARSPVESFNAENFLVLIVDDGRQNLQVVGSMLDEVGYATTFAIDGMQALERVKTAKPDLILLDLMMPHMNGLQVCETLKADSSDCEIPIIFLTASKEKDHLLQAFDCGAVDYITKPFSAPELLARVKTHLELKHTRDELRKALAKLEKLATTDSLTGVANRHHLLTIGKREFSRACRYTRPFSVLMLDIDHFKTINDTYGHAAGDEALKAMAKAAVNSLRQVDFFGRFGGEEFVAFLPETNIRAAVEVAERIRRTIARISLSVPDGVAYVTVSIGVATYRRGDRTLDAILKRADDALYAAKNQGRDRVVVDNTTSA